MYHLQYEASKRCISGEEITAIAGQNICLENDNFVRLIRSLKGVFAVTVGNQNFILPPSYVMVLPAMNLCHLSSIAGVVQVVSISQSAFEHSVFTQKEQTRILTASNIMRSLISEVLLLNDDYRDTRRENAILSLLLCEMRRDHQFVDQIIMKMPTDKRLLYVCKELLKLPSLPDNTDQWCRKAGMSRRSFTRTFKLETGMAFGEWRREVRLLMALSKIVSGEKIISAAYDVGYENVSTFSVAFSRRFGVPPGRYKSKMRECLSSV